MSARLEHVSFADAGHGWVTGTSFSEDYSETTGSVLLATVDGGATWRLQDPGTKALVTDVSCVDAAHCWLAGTTIDAGGGTPTGGVIMATADGGATWRQQYATAEAGLSALDFVDVTHGWLLAYPDSVLATTTGGWPANSQQSALGKASPIPWREAGLLSCLAHWTRACDGDEKG